MYPSDTPSWGSWPSSAPSIPSDGSQDSGEDVEVDEAMVGRKVFRVMRAYGPSRWLHVVHSLSGWEAELPRQLTELFNQGLHEAGFHFVRCPENCFVYYVKVEEELRATMRSVKHVASSLRGLAPRECRHARSRARVRPPLLCVSAGAPSEPEVPASQAQRAVGEDS